MTILLIFLATTSWATHKCSKHIRIAVIDTGLDLTDPRFFNHICRTGHKSFVPDGAFLDDLSGHGTFVAGLIQQYAGEGSNYCMVIYKYYQESAPGELNEKREVLALQAAVDNGADIVNFSGGGPDFNEEESLIIKNNPQITFVVAAGNDELDLDIPGNKFYPASLFYKNEEVIGNIDKNGKRAFSSNYSKKIKNWEVGVDVSSYLHYGKTGKESGTSKSTAIFSGKLVAKTLNSCQYR